MKNLTVILFSILNIVIGVAQQEWAPIGAKWHYGLLESPISSSSEGYMFFESIKDTTIYSKNCRIIHKTIHYSNGTIHDDGVDIFYNDLQKVYQLINGKFYILYDFGANKSDSWTTRLPLDIKGYPFPNDTMRTVTVDSIKYLLLASNNLKLLYVSVVGSQGNNFWTFKNPIIENIGSKYMFLGEWGLWDSNIPYLRCYSDSNIFYNENALIPCDTLIKEQIKTRTILKQINIYPAPVNDFLNIDFLNEDESPTIIKIVDITGKCLVKQRLEFHTNHLTIDISSLDGGIYCLILEYNNYLQNQFTKIIKL